LFAHDDLTFGCDTALSACGFQHGVFSIEQEVLLLVVELEVVLSVVLPVVLVVMVMLLVVLLFLLPCFSWLSVDSYVRQFLLIFPSHIVRSSNII